MFHNKLLAYREYGKESIFEDEEGKEINIIELLEGIEPEAEEKNKLNPIKIFISYSHKDSNYKIELLNHLSPLVRLDEIKVWKNTLGWELAFFCCLVNNYGILGKNWKSEKNYGEIK